MGRWKPWALLCAYNLMFVFIFPTPISLLSAFAAGVCFDFAVGRFFGNNY